MSGGFHAEGRTQLKALAPNAEQETRWRLFSMKFPVDVQHRRRAQSVGGVAGVREWPEALESERLPTSLRSIHEEHEVSGAEVHGMFHLKLEINQSLQLAVALKAGGGGCQATEEFRAEGIVPAAGIATADDQYSGVSRWILIRH